MTEETAAPSRDDRGMAVIIDDEPQVREALRRFLERSGFSVCEAESAAHAARFIERQKWNWAPSLIVCDLVMPGASGFEVLRQVSNRFRSKQVPIVAVSRYCTGEDVAEAELAGAHAFLAKPFKPSALLNALSEIEENFRAPVESKKHTILVFR